MQNASFSIEREVAYRLPALLADLLDEDRVELLRESPPDREGDLAFADSRGRRWVIEVKSSSGPGRVVDAARQLRRWTTEADPQGDAIPLLVVPYMSEAGARAAEDQGINWVDLSGNASIRAENLLVSVQGRPKVYASRGRPSSPFAPKSARVTRLLLLEPERWWRQKDLVEATGLDDSTVSRVARRLGEELLLEQKGPELRPRHPGVLLDAWAEDYRFARHDIVTGHVSGSGVEVARSLSDRLRASNIHHAFTGLAAAWMIDHFAGFRLTTVYVEGDPRDAADRLGVRQSSRGANVQLVGPDDGGVLLGERIWEDLNCVSVVQVYLDLLHLPERAGEAAQHLRAEHLWSRGAA